MRASFRQRHALPSHRHARVAAAALRGSRERAHHGVVHEAGALVLPVLRLRGQQPKPPAQRRSRVLTTPRERRRGRRRRRHEHLDRRRADRHEAAALALHDHRAAHVARKRGLAARHLACAQRRVQVVAVHVVPEEDALVAVALLAAQHARLDCQRRVAALRRWQLGREKRKEHARVAARDHVLRARLVAGARREQARLLDARPRDVVERGQVRACACSRERTGTGGGGGVLEQKHGRERLRHEPGAGVRALARQLARHRHRGLVRELVRAVVQQPHGGGERPRAVEAREHRVRRPQHEPAREVHLAGRQTRRILALAARGVARGQPRVRVHPVVELELARRRQVAQQRARAAQES
ncbi:hypothetical protein PybrP1_006049 [[Pythium] brassicae (nom. inval.)]|nr:hypothetical protein PybrP1_006049 [[Pythium] brassicae (nom. inval.)]